MEKIEGGDSRWGRWPRLASMSTAGEEVGSQPGAEGQVPCCRAGRATAGSRGLSGEVPPRSCSSWAVTRTLTCSMDGDGAHGHLQSMCSPAPSLGSPPTPACGVSVVRLCSSCRAGEGKEAAGRASLDS